MNELFQYLLKSGVGLVVLYLVYWLFLRKDTFFVVNRVYLVGSMIFSLVFPLFDLELVFPAETASPYYYVLDAVTINAGKIGETLTDHLTLMQVVMVVYLTGMAIFTIRFVFQLIQLGVMILKNGISRSEGVRMVFIDRNYSPFSFFNLIFINRNMVNTKNIAEVITHEQVHISQKHTLDLVLVEIMTIVQWFNPFVWFYRVSLKSIHEFLADEGVLLKGFTPAGYQHLLISQYMGIQVNDLTNNFNHSLLKKRFVMMTKNKSGKLARLKVLLATPMAIFLMMAFTTTPVVKTIAQVDRDTQKTRQQSEVTQDQQKDVGKDIQSDQDEEVIFAVVEDMPQFAGGEEARAKYFQERIKYPEEARKAGIQGTTYVSFIVEKDGSITNAKVLRGFNKACDELALNIVKEMPKWVPGKQRGQSVRVQFNMPIKFALGEKNTEEEKK